jgi:pyruvate formate lyase activating enzyme
MLVNSAGLKNIVVTNGFINKIPLEQLLRYADAFNVDLKAFDDDFFKKYTHSKLSPVLNALKQIRESNKHLEITNLVIPGLNDKAGTFREMVKWIAVELGSHTVLHLSRYFPKYKSEIESTSLSSLVNLSKIAGEFLSYVYVGNVSLSNLQDTRCHSCNSLLIKRNGYSVERIGINLDGSCMNCNAKVIVAS